MSEDNIKTWWSALTAQFGSVKKIGISVQGEVNTVHRNIEIPIEFEHVSATLTVRFSQNRQIDDWRIVPEERQFSFSTPPYDTLRTTVKNSFQSAKHLTNFQQRLLFQHAQSIKMYPLSF